ncbi:MAG: LL-diaminopimelate aminotransferase [Chloroflexota bacterium]|nr:LL-diaminopimelate aminotransferase [Chloroflexota bacterium]
MKTSKRIEKLPPYLFVEISRKIAEKRSRGEDVISFAIGDPDLPTPPHVIECLCDASNDPANHRYPESEGLPQLRTAIADWYKRRFGVVLDPDKEVLPLIGSKEGIGHMALCFIDPGDIALVPDPAYPVYSIGTMFAGGESYYIPLTKESGFLPILEDIPIHIAEKAKILWINYPNNPTAAVAEMDFYEKVVDFAKRFDLVVCHDAPYTDVAFDDYVPLSFMQVPGARDVGVEFHSLSKSYNMTGWRIGMMVGNSEMVDALMRVKSNLDSGIPQAIQHAAIKALSGPQDCIKEHNIIYQRRRDRIMSVLQQMGLEAMIPKASLYIWVRVPKGFTSAEFATKLLDEACVVVTPGTGYGVHGEGYFRISLTISDERLDEGLRRLTYVDCIKGK